MEQTPATPPPDPITRPELDARFREIRTRIWIVAAAAFLGSILGGFLKAGIQPQDAAAALWRLL